MEDWRLEGMNPRTKYVRMHLCTRSSMSSAHGSLQTLIDPPALPPPYVALMLTSPGPHAILAWQEGLEPYVCTCTCHMHMHIHTHMAYAYTHMRTHVHIHMRSSSASHQTRGETIQRGRRRRPDSTSSASQRRQTAATPTSLPIRRRTCPMVHGGILNASVLNTCTHVRARTCTCTCTCTCA